MDFDGHAEWHGIFGDNTYLLIEQPSFSMDDNPWRFSPAEQEAIKSIWATVAEDYAPFNVNVTTKDPGDISSNSHNLRVVIGGTDFRDSNDGGTSLFNSFTDPGYPNTVYVFSISKDPTETRSSDIKFIANTASHEAGHAFGLRHQSRWQSTPFGNVRIEEYGTR